mgnify:CR=1 FL=1
MIGDDGYINWEEEEDRHGNWRFSFYGSDNDFFLIVREVVKKEGNSVSTGKVKIYIR